MSEQKKNVNKDALKRLAMTKVIALGVVALMCFVVLIHLMVDKPSEAELKVIEHARLNGISALRYPRELIELLEENPETEKFVLNFPFHEENPKIDVSAWWDLEDGVPLFLQWDERWGYLRYGDGYVAEYGCGPMCLAMAGYYVTGDAAFYPDRVVEFAQKHEFYAPGKGTLRTLFSVGAPVMGLEVLDLAPVEHKVAAYLQAGYPIIAAMDAGMFSDAGHFVVLTGYNDGMVTINDPDSSIRSGKEWRFEDLKGQISELWVIRAGEEE